MKQNRAEVSCQVLGLNWFYWVDVWSTRAALTFSEGWYCDILGQNKLIMFEHSNRIFFTRAGHWAGWEEREPITVIGSFSLLPHPPRPAPPPISQIDSEESLKRPEARGQLGRGWGNLGGHGSGNSAESSDHPLSCLRDFVSQCLEKASTSVLWNL